MTETSVNKYVGKRIALYRERKGLSQSALARLLGMKPNYISRLESATYKIRVSDLVKIAKVLDTYAGAFIPIRPLRRRK